MEMNKNTELKRSVSCGTLPWRLHDNRHQVLLIKQFSHKEAWGIPKGHIDEGETFEDCAIRETREETGVEVRLEQRLPDMVTVYRDEHKQVVSFLAQPIGADEPNCSDPDCEVADVRWFDIDKLPNLHVYQRSMMQVAVELLVGRLTTSG